MRRAIGGTVLANTGLANTGLANTGLANTGLANTGLAGTGLVLTAVAAGLLLAWPAGPAIAAPASPRPATPASARPGARERFHLTSDNPSTRRENVQATGALTATGYTRAGDFAASRAVSVLVFPDGRLRLVTNATSTSQSVPNPETCKFTEVFKGSYMIHSGAGGYPNATGSGTYVSRIYAQLKKAKGGGCGTKIVKFWHSTRTAGSLHL
jgi:hypothetical protein